MAEAIVHVFEAVEIDEHARQARVLAASARQCHARQFFEFAAIGEPCQRIAERHQRESLFATLALARVAQRTQQAALGQRRLVHVVLCAEQHQLERETFVFERGAHHDRRPRCARAQPQHRIDARGVGQEQVAHDDVSRLVVQHAQRFAEALGALDREVVDALQVLGDQERVARVVIEDE